MNAKRAFVVIRIIVLSPLIAVMMAPGCKDSVSKGKVAEEDYGDSTSAMSRVHVLEEELTARNFIEKQNRRLPESDSSFVVTDSTVTMVDSGIVVRRYKRRLRISKKFHSYSKKTLRDEYEFQSEGIYIPEGMDPNDPRGDNRHEYYEVKQPRRKQLANGIAALFYNYRVEKKNSETSNLRTRRYNSYGVCETERYSGQGMGSFCTGFAVSENVILTAGHCISGYLTAENIRTSLKIVFEYRCADSVCNTATAKNTNIFTPRRLLCKGYDSLRGLDYALIEVRGTIPADRILPLAKLPVSVGDSVYIMGHPMGLPLKIADGATVKVSDSINYFRADLDAYGGNSGSPVLNYADSVVGILANGMIDFKRSLTEECLVTNTCTSEIAGCEGEKCSRNSVFLPVFRKEIPCPH